MPCRIKHASINSGLDGGPNKFDNLSQIRLIPKSNITFKLILESLTLNPLANDILIQTDSTGSGNTYRRVFELYPKKIGENAFISITDSGDDNTPNFEKELNPDNTDSQGYGAGYRYYEGLVQIATKTLYGDENDLETYPGIGAEGITFNVKNS